MILSSQRVETTAFDPKDLNQYSYPGPHLGNTSEVSAENADALLTGTPSLNHRISGYGLPMAGQLSVSCLPLMIRISLCTLVESM